MRKHTPPVAEGNEPLPAPYRDQHHDGLRRFNTFGIDHGSLRQLGVAALSAAALFSLQADPPGTIMQEKPVKAPVGNADNEVRVLLWNVAGRALANADTIQRLRVSSQADVILLQEVKHDDVKPLAQRLKTAYVTYVQGDPWQEWRDHGQGNAIISNTAPSTVQSEALSGTSNWQMVEGSVKGLAEDTASLDTELDGTRSGWQEHRAIQSQVQSFRTAYNTTINIQLANTHLAGSVYPEIHDRQMTAAAAYAGRLARSDLPVIMCGDFNANQAEGRMRFGALGFDSPYVDRPTTPSGKNPDQCHVAGKGVLELGQPEVIPVQGSDHDAVRFSWHVRDVSQPVPVRGTKPAVPPDSN